MDKCAVLSDDGVGEHVVHVKHVDAAFEEHAAVQSPAGAPIVTHHPEIADRAGSSITDDDDAVADGRAVFKAGGVAEHSRTYG